MYYYSIFQWHFKFIFRYRVEKKWKSIPATDIVNHQLQSVSSRAPLFIGLRQLFAPGLIPIGKYFGDCLQAAPPSILPALSCLPIC